MTAVRDRILGYCCGDLESADLVEAMLRREIRPVRGAAVLSSEQACPRCGWRLDGDGYCEFCSEISIRPVLRGGRSSAAPGTEEPT